MQSGNSCARGHLGNHIRLQVLLQFQASKRLLQLSQKDTPDRVCDNPGFRFPPGLLAQKWYQ